MSTPKNRMQIMQSVFGLTPGIVLTIPGIAEKLGLDYEKNSTTITALIQHFTEEGIISEVFPNCFVAETTAGGNKFLLVYTNVHDNIYVSNVSVLQARSFEDLAQDVEFTGFYRDEEWPVELKGYLHEQSATPSMRVAYGTSTPVDGHHDQAGYIETGHDIWVVDNEMNVSRRKFCVADLFNGTLKSYRAVFKTQNEALEYATYYTNPENQVSKRHRRNNLRNMDSAMNTCGSSKTTSFTDAEFTVEAEAPADQKRFSLNDINRCWDRFPGFDGSPYAQQLKQHFMDNALAKMI